MTVTGTLPRRGTPRASAPIPAPRSRARAATVRALQSLLVLFLAFTLVYVLLGALPGDAVAARYENPQLGLSQSQIDDIRSAYGLDQPRIIQYFVVLGGYLTGNFGYSVASGAEVSALLSAALPSTMVLAGAGIATAIVLAVLVAVAVALSPFSAAFRALPPLFVSLPAFLVGIILIQFVSFTWHLVPVIGANPIQQLILPTLTLAIPIAGPLAQVLVSSIDQVYTQPFVTVVRAKGAPAGWVLWRHVLRNAALPAVTMAGLLFGELIGGAVVTEAVFGRRGIGALTVDAVANRDTPVLLAVVVITVTAYVIINYLVDVIYPVLDVRLSGKA